MIRKRELRGFRIIKSERNGSLSLKLLVRNSNRFIVMFNKYFLGIPWKTRSYEFPCQEDAEYFYEKLFDTKFKMRSSLL